MYLRLVFVTFPNVSATGDTLEKLYIDSNEISDIDPVLFVPLVRLATLFIADNKLVTFPDLSSVGDTLQTLSVSRNKITSIPAARLDPLTELTYLSIYSNLLTELPDLTGPANSLTDLNAQDNPYKTVGSKEMQALNGIIDVDLRNTPFTCLPPVSYNKPTELDLRGSALDLCACNNIWLKKAEEGGILTLVVTDVTCPGATQSWTQITYDALGNVCLPAGDDCKGTKSTPTAEEPTPTAEQTTPKAEKTIPTDEEATPTVKQNIATDEQTTPTVEETKQNSSKGETNIYCIRNYPLRESNTDVFTNKSLV